MLEIGFADQITKLLLNNPIGVTHLLPSTASRLRRELSRTLRQRLGPLMFASAPLPEQRVS